jgi:hypothetical protein
VSEGTATGGSTTTVADTNLRTETSDYWRGGTVWILRDSTGTITAPAGEYARVTGYANTGGVLTFGAMTAAVAAGDKYAVAKRSYPLETLIRCVNQALSDLGTIPYTDKTTIDTVSNQTEYTLPNAANFDLRRVWMQNKLSDADDNRWSLLYNWYIERTATGTKDTLILPYQLPSGYDLKLEYAAEHPELHDYDDQLNEGVPLMVVVYGAVVRCLIWYQSKHNSSNRRLQDNIERYTELADRETQRWPRRLPPKTGKITLVSRVSSVDTSDPPNTVSLL